VNNQNNPKQLDDEAIFKALSQDNKPKLSNFPLEIILLILSLPVVVPSLIINWLMAKRWGRIDFILIAVDGFILLLFCLRSPIFTFFIVLAMIASSLLYIIRHDKLPYGIFLGYSDAVAWKLIVGGIIYGIGFFGFLPWGQFDDIYTLMTSRLDVPTRTVTDNRVAKYVTVTLTDGKIDWEKRIYLLRSPDGPYFASYISGKEITVKDPGDFWEKRKELLGTKVTYKHVVLSLDTYKRDVYDIQLSEKGKKETVRDTRVFSPVRESKGRLWIASAPLKSDQDKEGSEFCKRTSHSGTLVKIYNESNMGRWFYSRYAMSLPYIGVAILPDAETPQQPTPMVNVIQTWVPVKDTRQGLWMVYPGELTSQPPTPLKGVLENFSSDGEKLQKYLIDNPNNEYFNQRIQSIIAISPLEYSKQRDIFGVFMKGIKWDLLFFLIPGFFIILWAILTAKKE
jgi:hypothetical protein